MLTRLMLSPLVLHLGYDAALHLDLSIRSFLSLFLLLIFLVTIFGVNIDMPIAMLMQSLSHIMDASMEDLARCPGIGERKVRFLGLK